MLGKWENQKESQLGQNRVEDEEGKTGESRALDRNQITGSVGLHKTASYLKWARKSPMKVKMLLKARG